MANPYVLDFSAPQNMLARYHKAQMEQRGMDQQQGQFEQSNLLARERMKQDASQFGQSLGLQRDQLAQSGKQFGMSHSLDKGRLDLQRGEADERRAREFDRQAAGIGQMVLEDQDPASRAAKWQRLVSSDPRWSKALAKSGVDSTDPVAGAQFIIAQARGYKEPEGYKLTELDSDKTLIGTNPKTGESRVIREPTNAGGFKGAKDRADVESGLRKEVEKYASDYTTIRNASANIEAIGKNPSAASDISLIFSFMKVLDPSSVVRETEFATAQNAAGVPERVSNVWNRVLSGQRLSPEQRADFLKQAQTLSSTQRAFYQTKLDQYRGVAERLKIDPNNVILTEPENRAGASGGASPESKTIGGKTYLKVDGQWYQQ